MRRVWRVKAAFVCGLAAVGVLMVFASKQAEARPKYNTEFKKKYPEVVKANDVEKTVKCNVCHIGKTNSKKWNAYGVAIGKAVGKKNQMDVKEIEKGLTKVEGEKSEMEGKTFGDLLKDKKLPATVGKEEKKAE